MGLHAASLEDGTELPADERMIADLEAKGVKVHRRWGVGIMKNDKVAATASFNESFRQGIDGMTWRDGKSGVTVRHSMVAVESENGAGASVQLYGVVTEIEVADGRKSVMFEPIGQSDTGTEAAAAAAGFARFMADPKGTPIAFKDKKKGGLDDSFEIKSMSVEKYCKEVFYLPCVSRVKTEYEECASSCYVGWGGGTIFGGLVCLGMTVAGTPIAGTICYVVVVGSGAVGYKRCIAVCLDSLKSKLDPEKGVCIAEYRQCLRETSPPGASE
jgi:hypothetical protein